MHFNNEFQALEDVFNKHSHLKTMAQKKTPFSEMMNFIESSKDYDKQNLQRQIFNENAFLFKNKIVLEIADSLTTNGFQIA